MALSEFLLGVITPSAFLTFDWAGPRHRSYSFETVGVGDSNPWVVALGHDKLPTRNDRRRFGEC